MGEVEKKKEGGGAPAATAAAVGHAWRRHAGAGHGDGHAVRREGRKKERGKRGVRFAAVGRDASRWVGNGWDVN